MFLSLTLFIFVAPFSVRRVPCEHILIVDSKDEPALSGLSSIDEKASLAFAFLSSLPCLCCASLSLSLSLALVLSQLSSRIHLIKLGRHTSCDYKQINQSIQYTLELGHCFTPDVMYRMWWQRSFACLSEVRAGHAGEPEQEAEEAGQSVRVGDQEAQVRSQVHQREGAMTKKKKRLPCEL
jgi:hypothetical protein